MSSRLAATCRAPGCGKFPWPESADWCREHEPRTLDLQLQLEHAACLRASDVILALQPLWDEIREAAEDNSDWEGVELACRQLAHALDAAHVIRDRSTGYAIGDVVHGPPAECWAVVDSDNVIQSEDVYFLKAHAEEEMREWPDCRLVHFVERVQKPKTERSRKGGAR